jgi:hypothetical protein
MLNTVVKQKTAFFIEVCFAGDAGLPTFNEVYRMSDKRFRFLRLILKPRTAPRRIKPMHISGSTVRMIGELTDDD